MGAVKAGAIYFLLVFAAGWVLGPIREILIVPRFGRLIGTLSEAPLMLLAMLLSAQWTLLHFAVPYALCPRFAVGAVALAMLTAAELTGVRWVRGILLKEYLASFATAAGLISLLLFLLFAAMPLLVRRS